MASQLKKDDEAYDFFGFATRLDLDNYNRNTNQGIHTTSIAAAWMNIVYGFGGLRTDGEKLKGDGVVELNVYGKDVEINSEGYKCEVE